MPKSIEKRLYFKCWNCDRTYSLFREIRGEPVLYVKCPFCASAAQVDLNLTCKKRIVKVFRNDDPAQPGEEEVWDFPDELPTAPVEQDA